MIWRPACTVLLVALATVAFAACDDGEDNGGASTPPASTATAGDSTPTQPSENPQAIRALDLSQAPAVDDLLSQTNGRFVQENVIYADVNGDGVEEAVVPAASSGTLGYLGFTVLALNDDSTEALLTETAAGAGMGVEVSGGDIIETQPVPGPDDPECCPSMLKRTTYSWNGNELVVADEVTVPNPDVGGKITPSAVQP